MTILGATTSSHEGIEMPKHIIIPTIDRTVKINLFNESNDTMTIQSRASTPRDPFYAHRAEHPHQDIPSVYTESGSTSEICSSCLSQDKIPFLDINFISKDTDNIQRIPTTHHIYKTIVKTLIYSGRTCNTSSYLVVTGRLVEEY